MKRGRVSERPLSELLKRDDEMQLDLIQDNLGLGTLFLSWTFLLTRQEMHIPENDLDFEQLDDLCDLDDLDDLDDLEISN